MPTWNELYPRTPSFTGGNAFLATEPWRTDLKSRQLPNAQLYNEALFQHDNAARDIWEKAQIKEMNDQTNMLNTFQGRGMPNITGIFRQPQSQDQANINEIIANYAKKQDALLKAGLASYPQRLSQYFAVTDRNRLLRNDAFNKAVELEKLRQTSGRENFSRGIDLAKLRQEQAKANALAGYRTQRLNDQRVRAAQQAQQQQAALDRQASTADSAAYDDNVRQAIHAVTVAGMNADTAADLFGLDDRGRAVLNGYQGTYDTQDQAIIDNLNKKESDLRFQGYEPPSESSGFFGGKPKTSSPPMPQLSPSQLNTLMKEAAKAKTRVPIEYRQRPVAGGGFFLPEREAGQTNRRPVELGPEPQVAPRASGGAGTYDLPFATDGKPMISNPYQASQIPSGTEVWLYDPRTGKYRPSRKK